MNQSKFTEEANWYHLKYAAPLPKAFNTYNTGFE